MIDYGALPPEVNSGRMYAGAGAGPMTAAAAAWEDLAAELGSSAAGYSTVTAELTGAPWLGPASRSMMAAVTPFIHWLRAAGALADAAGARARAVVLAYETAFLMTVPPSAIAANRATLAALIATNFFGQNTAAIAATEAQYAEMWAQDATAMYGYAAASTASQLAPFVEPTPTTDQAGLAQQQAAVTLASAGTGGPSATQTAINDMINSLSSQIKGLLFGALDVTFWPMTYLGSLIFSQIGVLWPEHLARGAAAGLAATPALAAPVGLSGGSIAANLASSNKIGPLSVPTGWVATAPTAAEEFGVRAIGTEGLDSQSTGPETMLRQLPPARGRRDRGGLPPREYGFRPRIIARPPSAG